MPTPQDKVMTMVEKELRKNPSITTAELRKKAEAVDSEVAGMSARQFNATYPLQAKRRIAAEQPRPRSARRRRPRTPEPDRGKIRDVLLQLAKDIAAAEGKVDVVEVVSGIDRYVDRVVQAASGR